MSKNLDLFNQQTAEIFAVVWENFAVPQVITYEKFNASLPDDYFDQLTPSRSRSAGVNLAEGATSGTR